MKNSFIRTKWVVSVIVLCGLLFVACGDDGAVSVPPVSDGAAGQQASSDAEGASLPGNTSEPVGTGNPVSDSGQASAGEFVVTEQSTAEPTGTPVPEEPETPRTVQIVISATGDVTLGNYLGQGYTNSFDYTYEQGVGDSYFFENVAEIFAADDLTLVNLEGPLTNSEEHMEGKTFTISGDTKYVNILLEGNVEAVSMANNHRLDYLEKGTEDTVAALAEAGIRYAYDGIVGICEVQGIRIGMVSVNEVDEGWLVEEKIKAGIMKVKEADVNLVIVSCHWGVEKDNYPEDYQQKLGKKCVDWGADLVLGHHPHVLQGIEEYEGKYIVYSLGNFCFGANKNPSDKDSMIFQQTFTFEGGMLQEDKEIRVIPCSISSVTKRNDYKPTPATEQEAARIIGRINEFSAGFGLQFDEDGYLKK